jgi:hypothetical protein
MEGMSRTKKISKFVPDFYCWDMASFLELLAKDLIRKHGTDFSELTIIFPNKRAGLFLAEELAKLINQPIWMPEILTLSEYIEKHTGLKKAEPISLIIKLYKSYIKVSKSSLLIFSVSG